MQLSLETIPARILPNVQPGEEVLTIQLIENLQRQEIDPIDKANAILEFFQSRHEGMALAFLSMIEVIERAKAGGGTAKETEPSPEEKVS